MREEIKQKEGLCFMNYQCKECEKIERIWNSRPRVSPFMIGCSGCNGIMVHINWESDEYAPNYQPKKGDRIFVDWSRADEERMRKVQIEKYWDDEDFPMKDNPCFGETKEKALEYFMNEWTFGQPAVETI